MKHTRLILLAVMAYFLCLCISSLAEMGSEAKDLQVPFRWDPNRILTRQEQSKYESLVSQIQTNIADSHSTIISQSRPILRLGEMCHSKAFPILKEIVEDENVALDIRATALYAAQSVPSASLIEFLINQLTNQERYIRDGAMTALFQITGEYIVPDIPYNPNNPEVYMHQLQVIQEQWGTWWKENQDTFEMPTVGKAYRNLPRLDPDRTLTPQEQEQMEILIARIESTSADGHSSSVDSIRKSLSELKKLHHKQTMPIFIKVAQDDHETSGNRVSAMNAILKIPDQLVVDIFIDLLGDQDPIIQSTADKCLRGIAEMHMGPSVYVISPEERELRYHELQNNWRAWWQENKGTFVMPANPRIILD